MYLREDDPGELTAGERLDEMGVNVAGGEALSWPHDSGTTLLFKFDAIAK